MRIYSSTITRFSLFLIATWIALPAHAEVININYAELRKLISQGVPVIDVRRDDEWNDTGVIENSHLLTFFDEKGKYDATLWHAAFSTIVKKHDPVILICHSGARTSMISQWLSDKVGHATVYNVTNGIVPWLKENKASRLLQSNPEQ